MMSEKYTIVQTINDSHKIYLVKSVQDNSFYVKKILNIYDKSVYEWLINHPIKGVPVIKEIEENDNKLIVIEEYISGKTLESILEDGKRFSEKEVIEIITSICHILKQITDKIPLVHRDIKPSNIVINEMGELYLIDFNTAKIFDTTKSKDTILLGTEGYAAPEQYGFASSNIQTDIYAIGVLMKELLTGSIDLNEKYDNGLKSIIQKCTMMDPKTRYEDYQSLINQLKGDRFFVIKRYLPVGFRSGNIVSMIFSTMWYMAIILGSSTIGVEGAGPFQLLIDRIVVGIAFVLATFFAGNYLECQERLGITKIKNRLIRIIVIIFFSFMIMVSFVIFFLLLTSLFE